MAFFGALRTPRARAGRQVDARGGPARKGRSPRVPGQLADLFAMLPGRLQDEVPDLSIGKRPAYVTCPIGDGAATMTVVERNRCDSPRGGTRRVRGAILVAL